MRSMITIILAVLFGIGIAYFAIQNAFPVTIHVGTLLLPNIPIYSITIVAFLIGLFVAWVIGSIESVGDAFALHHKDVEMKDRGKTIQELRERIRSLELENTRLKQENHIPIVEKESPPRSPSFFQRFRHAI